MSKKFKFDKTDFKIIEILMSDGKKPYSEVANKLNVSHGTVHFRMNKLIEAGAIEKTTLKINYARFGYDITAFVGIYLSRSNKYPMVLEELKKINEITNIHFTTGKYSMFIQIHCKDTSHLKQIIHEQIQQIEGVDRTETIISLEKSLDRSVVIPF